MASLVVGAERPVGGQDKPEDAWQKIARLRVIAGTRPKD